MSKSNLTRIQRFLLLRVASQPGGIVTDCFAPRPHVGLWQVHELITYRNYRKAYMVLINKGFLSFNEEDRTYTITDEGLKALGKVRVPLKQERTFKMNRTRAARDQRSDVDE